MTRPSPTPEEHASRRARIERLAHQIWESEGRPEGQATRHWGMAERLVEAEEAGAVAAAQAVPQERRPRRGTAAKAQPAPDKVRSRTQVGGRVKE